MAANTTRKAFTVKSDANADAGKSLVLEIDWTGMSLDATRDLATKDIVIRVQGSLRKKLSTVKAGQVVKVSAVNYTTTAVDPKLHDDSR
jgi:hypothetical protein